MRPGMRPVSTVYHKPVDKILPTFVYDVVEGTDDPIRFLMSRDQGHGYSEVRYLSELLLQCKHTHQRLGIKYHLVSGSHLLM